MKPIMLALVAAMSISTPQGDDILQKAINTPSIAYSFYGTGQSAKLIRDKAVPGGQAWRVAVSKGATAFDSGASFAIGKSIAKGDRIVVAFWSRAPAVPEGQTLTVAFAGLIGPAPGYVQVIGAPVRLDRNWQIRQVKGVAAADYPAGAAAATIHLGGETATIELGPMFVLDLGQATTR